MCVHKLLRFTSCLCALVLLVAPLQAVKRDIELELISSFQTTDDPGAFDEGAAEIVAYDKKSQRLFVVNGFDQSLEIWSIADPFAPEFFASIDLTPYGNQGNSVAVNNGLVAVAVEADTATDPGSVVFFDADGAFLKQFTVGALPDMLTFTPNGRKVLVANEGEPDGYEPGSTDPEGSVSIIDLTRGLAKATVQTADFVAFNGATLDPSIRIFGPGATVAQDLEPEYIAVSTNSKTAWVVLQENNALGVIDIDAAEVTALVGLGFKDHSLMGNGFDGSNDDDAINIAQWPVFGMYQPDGIAAFQSAGETFIVSGNEGDAREYDGFEEEADVEDLTLDDDFPYSDLDFLQSDNGIGPLTVTDTLGDTDGDGDYDELYAFGARSFSIWTSNGELVWDSGDDFEQITAAAFPRADFPDAFNTNNDENDFDDRSDNKGPEPEGVAVGKVYGRTYAFIGLERVGGIMVYDVTDPYDPEFVQYVNNRDFGEEPDIGEPGLGPEGILFIPAGKSPIRFPLLVVANEVGATVDLYAVTNR